MKNVFTSWKLSEFPITANNPTLNYDVTFNNPMPVYDTATNIDAFPVCGKWVAPGTTVCPHCKEIIWEE